MKLISAIPSPYARKIRIVLAKKEIARVVGDHGYAVREAFGIADHPDFGCDMDEPMQRPSFQTTTPSPQTITAAAV